MIVVCNSTPLVHLSAMNKLEVLKELFGEIRIPEEVYQEIVLDGAGKPGAKEVKMADWISAEAVQDRLAVQTLNSYLGLGESACIVLAKQLSADLLIFDDRLARLESEALNLNITGTIGVLILSDKKGMLDFPTSVDELLATGFRLSAKDYKHIINLWRSQKK